MVNQLAGVTGLALNSFRQLYVADASCNRIVRFPSNFNSTTTGLLIASLNPLTDDLYIGGDGSGNASNQRNISKSEMDDQGEKIFVQ